MAHSNERGAAAIEYAILIAAIAGVIALVSYQVGLRAVSGLQTLSAIWS